MTGVMLIMTPPSHRELYLLLSRSSHLKATAEDKEINQYHPARYHLVIDKTNFFLLQQYHSARSHYLLSRSEAGLWRTDLLSSHIQGWGGEGR